MRFAIYGLRGNGGTAEPVHPDHVAYYSYSTLKLLIERQNLHIDEFLFYDLGKEHRTLNPWYINLMNDVCVKISPQLADGVIAVCKLAANKTMAVNFSHRLGRTAPDRSPLPGIFLMALGRGARPVHFPPERNVL